jgi:ribose transport system ATP-binding protein
LEADGSTEGASGALRARPGRQGRAFSAPGDATRAIIELRDVDKLFIHSQALRKLTLSIFEGEILGIVGHNGAGKSTVVNILTGTLHPTSGTILVDGAALRPDYDVRQANTMGIRAVFQELSLCPNLSVIENMKVFHPELTGMGWRSKAERMIRSTLDAIFPGHDIHPRDVVENLSLSQRQVVEIAKAFCGPRGHLKLVILDEPTSALDARTSRQLTDFVNSLSGGSLSVIYISHLLDEVLACTNRVAVLKDGSNAGVLETREATRQAIIELMGEARLLKDMGAEAAGGDSSRNRDYRGGGTFVVEPAAEDGRVRLRVREGEVVGLAGLAGHGQTELLHRLFDSRRNGLYRVKGRATFIPGDRQADGIFPLWSVAKNISLQVYDSIRRLLLIDLGKEKAVAEKWRDSIGIRVDSVTRGILSLSGGNQQKVLFARCLESRSPLVLMDDPTRGVDVGTKEEIYRLIMDESRKGRSFVWYTTEMNELKYCDRIYVFRSGDIIAELAGDEATEEDILKSSF